MEFNRLKMGDDSIFKNLERFLSATVLLKLKDLYGTNNCSICADDTCVRVHVVLGEKNTMYNSAYNEKFEVRVNKLTYDVNCSDFLVIRYAYHHFNFIVEALKILDVFKSFGFNITFDTSIVLCDVLFPEDYEKLTSYNKHTFICLDYYETYKQLQLDERSKIDNVRIISDEDADLSYLVSCEKSPTEIKNIVFNAFNFRGFANLSQTNIVDVVLKNSRLYKFRKDV